MEKLLEELMKTVDTNQKCTAIQATLKEGIMEEMAKHLEVPAMFNVLVDEIAACQATVLVLVAKLGAQGE